MECGVWGVECGVWSVEWGVWSVVPCVCGVAGLRFVCLGMLLFLMLAFPVVFLLEHLQSMIAGDIVPPIIGLVFLVSIFAVHGGLAFVAPPRILSLFGIFSHRLTPSSLLEQD